MMDQDLKAKWIAALRSGEYQQGTMFFENEGHYCCLGVLCKVAGESPFKNPPNKSREGNWSFVRSVIHPGEKIDIRNDPVQGLAQMNDSGWTFPQIADWIEANL